MLAFQRQTRIGMKLFFSGIKRSARLAFFLLAVHFAALPSGYVARAAAQSAPAASFVLLPAEFVDAGSLAVASLAATADAGQTACAFCAVATMANTALLAIPPLFLLPQAVELLHLTVGAEFVRLRPPRVRHAS